MLHIIVLPGALGLLFAYHMWRVRKDGGLARADRAALLAEKAEEPPTPTKTYTLLGRGPGHRSRSSGARASRLPTSR